MVKLGKNFKILPITLLLLFLALLALPVSAAGQDHSLNVNVQYLLGQPIAEASVYIDGELQGTTDANGLLMVSGYVPGTHNITVVHEEYETVSKDLGAQVTEITIRLQYKEIVAPTDAVTIIIKDSLSGSLVSGATVSIDGVKVGETDNYGKLWVTQYTGEHTVTAAKKGMIETTAKVDFVQGGTGTVSLDREEKKYSIFDVELFFYALSKELGLGLVATIKLSVIAFAIGICIGLVMGLGRVSRNIFYRYGASVYVEGVRGLPLVLQILFVYYGLPFFIKDMIGMPIVINEFYAAIIALSINSGAYMAEIFKAGIEAIPKGQMEASRSVGMTYWQAMFYVILPQAFKIVLPTLGNEFIALIKDSSIALVISYQELTYWAKAVGYEYYNAFTPLVAAGCLYLLITLPLGKLIQYIEKRFNTTNARKEGAGLFGGRKRRMGGNKPEGSA